MEQFSKLFCVPCNDHQDKRPTYFSNMERRSPYCVHDISFDDYIGRPQAEKNTITTGVCVRSTVDG